VFPWDTVPDTLDIWGVVPSLLLIIPDTKIRAVKKVNFLNMFVLLKKVLMI
jgi:hypothetical protein